MMPASKHGDPQLGVDIHMCVVPPSPSPVPLPTPHTSIVFDPFDYIPIIGATVTVCGMKRATAGTNGIAIHIPPGFPFAPKLPDKDDELFMGSATVVADGDPFSFIALPVLSCQVAGMVSPFRPRKKGGIKMMVLPTVFNLAIPTTVVVGGPPTISLLGLAFKGAFAALGKFAKSGLFRRIRQKLFRNMNPGFLKCKILRAEPVNILSGEVVVEQEDFTLPGRLPIEWVRRYTSGHTRHGACGWGWETIADTRLEVDPLDGTVCLRHPTVGPLYFARLPLRPGDEGYELELVDGARLTDHGDELRVRTKEGRLFFFPKALAAVNDIGVAEYPLGRIADPCGNWLELERRNGHVSAIVESAGRRIDIVRDPQHGRIREVTLGIPGTDLRHVFVRYEYDAAGDLVAAVDALGHAYRFAYQDHHLVRHTDRAGLSFYYEYDTAAADGWRVVHSWGDGGLYDYRFQYDDVLRERRITDSLGQVWLVKLDERGLPISEIDPLGGMTVYGYDESGRTTAVVDPAGRRTSLTYDDSGNVIEQRLPDGAVISKRYRDGRLAAIVDPNGGEWQQQWSPRGLVVAQTGPLGHTTRFEYDRYGQLTAVVNPKGAAIALWYDGFGNLARLTDPAGRWTEFRHDERGNVLSQRSEDGVAVSYTYDAMSRLIAIRRGEGRPLTYTYDAEGRLVSATDAAGRTTRWEHVGLGEIARRVHADGSVVEYEYDPEERLIAVRNPRGEVHQLKRDALGRVVEEVDYWGCSRRYFYDPGDHLLAMVDHRGRRIDYECDPLGRVVKKVMRDPAHPAAEPFVETLTFNPGGQLVEAINPHVVMTRSFDGEGRLLKEEQRHADGQCFILENEYDACGNRVRRRSSAGGTVEYSYDPLDIVSAIHVNGVRALQIERASDGAALVEHLGSSLTRRYEYDDGRLLRQTVSRGAGTLFSTRYGYDHTGALVSRVDTDQGGDRYEWDGLGRVIAHLDQAGRRTEYLHDPAGGRLVTRGAGARGVGWDAPDTDGHGGPWVRDGSCDDTWYRFDAAGHLVRRRGDEGTLELEWDADGRLIGTSKDGTRTRYGYDPLGRRLFKETGGRRTWFFWDGDVLAGEQWAGPDSASRVREYVYEPDTCVARACLESGPGSPARLYFFDSLPNGAPTRAIDENGVTVWSVGYTAWGGVARVFVDDLDIRLRLQGQYSDPETGLSYNRYRYFDPAIGQFISPDPLGTAAGEGTYAYASNAVEWADPLGLACERATGHHLVDRIAGEIDAAVAHASRMLDRGLTGGTPWGRIYQNLVRHNPNHWLVPIARGNAVQQIADSRLASNRYLREAGVVMNQGHLHGLRNGRNNVLRPDYQVPLEGGRLGIIDVTTTGQGPKISKYIDKASPGRYAPTNVFY